MPAHRFTLHLDFHNLDDAASTLVEDARIMTIDNHGDELWAMFLTEDRAIAGRALFELALAALSDAGFPDWDDTDWNFHTLTT